MYLPLRGFQLVSDKLDYLGGDNPQVRFSTLTQNYTRSAIVGISYFSPADPFAGLLHGITRFEVAGRPYKQGDDVPLGLLASGANPSPVAPGVQYDYKRSYFPGSKIPLSDGTYCSGVLLNGREDVRMQLNRSPGAGIADISNIILHCLEFPRAAYPRGIQDAIDQLWDRFASGIGQFHAVGNLQLLAAGAPPFQATLEALVNPPHRQNARRTEVRGEAASALIPPALSVNETYFQSLTLQVYGQGAGATPTSNGGVPAREIAGHANLHHRDQVGLDFERDSRSLILVTAPAPAFDTAFILATLFEGTDRAGVKLCGPAVF